MHRTPALREISVQAHQFSAFNDNLVRQLAANCKAICAEAKILTSSLIDDDGVGARVCCLNLNTSYLKKLLLLYQLERSEAIKQCRFNRSPEKMALMSRLEQNLLAELSDLYRSYSSDVLGVGFAFCRADRLPPKELYVHIQVIKDCGTLQTDQGGLRLDSNSSHFIRRSHIDGLLSQGFVRIIGSKPVFK